MLQKFKKIIIIILTAAITCIAANAQNNLKGSWANIHTVMGTTINEVLVFGSELSGNVEHKASIDLSSSMMGAKLEGEMEMSIKGIFEHKDGKLIIEWDTESLQLKTVKPLDCRYKGESVPEMKSELEKVMATVLEDIKKNSTKENIYESVTFKNGKLILTERDEKGKKHSETYEFVSHCLTTY